MDSVKLDFSTAKEPINRLERDKEEAIVNYVTGKRLILRVYVALKELNNQKAI